jgi:hypothetical protein
MRSFRRVFWPVEETLVVAFLFAIVFGAVRPGEVLPLTLICGVLLIAWVVHAWQQR